MSFFCSDFYGNRAFFVTGIFLCNRLQFAKKEK